MSKVALLGTGPGAQAAAGDLMAAGNDVSIADLPEFTSRLASIRERGGVALASGWRGQELIPVQVADSIDAAVSEADVVVVSAAPVSHDRFADALQDAPAGAIVLFLGGGGGAVSAWRMLQSSSRTDLVVGETNCLPFIARLSSSDVVQVTRKSGGVLVAAIPAENTDEVESFARGVWPIVEAAGSIWETLLVNYDAIDVVPVALMNAGPLESRPGGMLLWGEGATPAVVSVIESVDLELLELRRALGGSDERRYRDFLIAQGLAPDVGTDVYAVMRAGGIAASVRPSGTFDALRRCLETEVPHTLAFASSLGATIGVPTPVIDSLITLASVVLGQDMREVGQTLERLGLRQLDRDGLRSYAQTGSEIVAPTL